MRFSVEKLRIWLLAGAALLVLVVVGFLGLARWKAHRFLTELPAKLGADIRQETNAFTYSQTVKGRTVYTVHAAKAIQHKDGKYTLHDVGIAVYGRGQTQGEQPAGQKPNERVDRIYGKEFDLDRAAGIVKAVGEVHLDLEAPAAKDAKSKMDYAAGTDLKPNASSVMNEGKPKAGPGDDLHEVGRGDKSLIHVKTSNLVYLEKLGVAASDEDIEFEYNGLTGHAKGAEYNADTGILRLEAAVKVSGLQHGKPILLTASEAELDRINHKVMLTDAEYLTVSGDRDNSRARQTVKAKHAVVLMREGSGVERINGDSGVTITAGEDTRVSGDRGEAFLNDEGRPVNARIWGNVMYAADDETRHGKGSSSDARLSFDRAGHADKVVLGGGVHMTEQVLAAAQPKTDAKPTAWSNRDLSAATVDMSFDGDAAGRTRPRDAKATGGAKLRVTDPGASGKGQRTSVMAADLLTAHFTTGAATSQLEVVKGAGATSLERTTETGVQENSTGDELEVHFRGGAKADGASQISTAVQRGHVVLTRHTPGKGDAPAQTDKATAEKAAYDGGTQLLTLSGQVQLSSVDGMLWADRMVVEQKTGDASAEGGVKASLKQGSQQESVHVLAQRAELKKASGDAIFHGTSGASARLWQGGSQVEAPVLEFNQKQRTLLAHGEGAGYAMAVHTVMVRSGNSALADDGKSMSLKAVSLTKRATVVRIASREMRYSDAQREAEFSDGVKVESADGVMKGDRAVALLESANQKKTAPKEAETSSFMAGGIERVTLTGQIEITQPGRRATGDRLVYTAGDGLFVLTGSAGAPPRVVDQARGMVTGVELSFRASDESVVVSNGEKGSSGARVHTETRVKRDR